MNQDEMKEFAELRTFYQRGSSYDVMQIRESGGWGAAWTFAPCDVHAAEKAGWMLRRMGTKEMRHARRARLHTRTDENQSVVIVTNFPARTQVILRMTDGRSVRDMPYLEDAALAALEASFGADT